MLPLLIALFALTLAFDGGVAQQRAPRIDAAQFLTDVGLDGARRAREEHEEMQEPGDAILARQLFGSDTLPTDAFPKAARQARALDPTDGRWEFVGPDSVGGRVLDIAVDPTAPNTIYVASASGGVWKSKDAGMTMTSVWPDYETQAIGALAITPSGTLFAGTGEPGPGGGSITFGGTGVYRSRDGGASWQRVGLPQSSRIGRIVVDPKNEQRIFVAAIGPLFKGGGERGLYRSDDGGETFKQVLAGENETTGVADVAIDPSDSRRMYATTWDLLREPDRRRYTGPGSGLWRSEDGGDSWQRIGSPTFGPHPALSRLGVAVAPSAPDTIYVIASGESGAGIGFYRSNDRGDTFTPAPDPTPLTTSGAYVYGWWFGRVWVDPADVDHVFVAGVELLESTDGGLTFGTTPAVHADQHALVWDPKVPKRVYLGNDGGVYRSDENGAGFTFAVSQPFHQLYSLDVSEQDPKRMTAGLQDNGAVRSYPDGWNEYIGGDGQRTLINPKDENIVYGCYQYGECSVSHDGGTNTTSFTNQVVSSRKNWFTPIEFDPLDPTQLYTGGEIISHSDDHGATWTPISPDLSNGAGRETNPLFRNFGTVTTIAPAPAANGTIYAGTDDGNLWYTHSGVSPAGWTKAADPDLPAAWITRVEIDPRDPKVAYVSYSGFRQADDAAYLLRTRDGGVSWDNITGDLPKAPLNDVNVIGDRLVVASDVGVFVSRDGSGTAWRRAGAALPLAPVFELKFHKPTSTLYAGTFGRGIYRIPLAALDADPAPAGVVPVVVLKLRLASGCLRRGRLTTRLRVSGAQLKSARITAGKRKVTLRGKKLTRSVRLTRVRGRRVVVRVRAVATDGRVVTAKRTFRACR